jgi:hypothetical protein
MCERSGGLELGQMGDGGRHSRVLPVLGVS